MDKERRAETEAQQPDPEPVARHGPSAYWLIGPPVFLLLYVLSVGPVAKYYDGKTGGPPRSIETFYAPLGFLATRVPFVDSFFRWYIDKIWCRPAPPAKPTPPASGEPAK